MLNLTNSQFANVIEDKILMRTSHLWGLDGKYQARLHGVKLRDHCRVCEVGIVESKTYDDVGSGFFIRYPFDLPKSDDALDRLADGIAQMIEKQLAGRGQ